MTKPVTIPNTFATQSGNVPASELDADYAVLAAAINDVPTYGNYFTDTGAVNAMVVTTTPSLTFTYSAGVWIDVLVANTNTSSNVTLNVNGLGAQLVHTVSGNAIPLGALVGGTIYHMMFDGTNFRVSLPSYIANVLTFGADPGGGVDSTAAIQAAINTGGSVYLPAVLGPFTKYTVSSMMTMATPGQRIYGDGVNSLIFATTGFNLAQQGMFMWTPSTYSNGAYADAPWFANLHLSCDQSGVATPPGAAIASASQTVANPGVFTTAAQTWVAGQPVYITGTAPGGFSTNIVYYVIAAGLTGTTVELSTTVGGTGLPVTASSACSLQPCFSRTNLVQYPAAIYCRNGPRLKVTNCVIEQFLIGIDVQGFSAGMILDILALSVYTLGVVIDGNGDTIQMNYLHCVPYDTWTPNQKAIYFDGGKTDITTGRNDGMDLINCAFLGPCVAINSFVGTGVHYPGTYAGSGWLTGKTNALITNTGFDTSAQILQSASTSTLLCFNCYFSNGSTGNVNMAIVTGGALQICGGFAQSTPIPLVPFFVVNNTSAGIAQLSFSAGFTFNAGAGTTTLIALGGPTLSLVSICDCNFLITNGTNGPLITSTGANIQLQFTGNQFGATNKLGNIALSIDTDNTHVIQGNALNGWNLAVPPGTPIASASQTVATPGVFTTAAQTWAFGQQVYITGTAPGNFALNTIYYVIAAGLSTTTAELALTPGGAGIQCTSSAACSLVPVNVTNFTKTMLSNNSNRGTVNFNNGNFIPFIACCGNTNVATNATVYLGPGAFPSAILGGNFFLFPKAGTIIGFQVRTINPIVAGTCTYTIYQNGVATGMTGVISSGSTLTVSAPSLAIAAGDRLEVLLVTAGATVTFHTVTVLFEPA